MINLSGIESDISLQSAQRAYEHVSFRSDKRGEQVVADYIDTLTRLAAFITEKATDDRQKEIAQDVFNGLREGYKRRYLKWLGAQSRCISSMITGPANFPVRRAEKANESERRRSAELYEFSKAMPGYALKSLNGVFSIGEKVDGELQQKKRRLDNAVKLQEVMKQANALIRKKDMDGLRALLGPERAVAIMIPNCFNGIGFERFELTNNLALIKRLTASVHELEKKGEGIEAGTKTERALAGLRIVENAEADRLQLIFDGKPPEGVRGVLKSHGFKWSPRYGAWQRQLTANAKYALEHYVFKQEAFKAYTQTAEAAE